MIDHTNYNKLPEHMRESARRYVQEGVIPGDFLQAVLRNDLVRSFSNADDINIMHIRDWAHWLYNEAPSHCWGSHEALKYWHERGGLNGRSDD